MKELDPLNPTSAEELKEAQVLTESATNKHFKTTNPLIRLSINLKVRIYIILLIKIIRITLVSIHRLSNLELVGIIVNQSPQCRRKTASKSLNQDHSTIVHLLASARSFKLEHHLNFLFFRTQKHQIKDSVWSDHSLLTLTSVL